MLQVVGVNKFRGCDEKIQNSKFQIFFNIPYLFCFNFVTALYIFVIVIQYELYIITLFYRYIIILLYYYIILVTLINNNS